MEPRTHRPYTRAGWTLALILTAALLALPASSYAAFPGVNGELAFARNSTTIDLMAADGVAGASFDDGYEPAWSPDGRRIAFTSTRSSTPGAPVLHQEIYVMNADGSGVTRVTNNPAQDAVHPAWSPDGRRIAFTSFSDIYVANADGSGSPINLTNDQPPDAQPSWSPDGTRIAYESERDNHAEIIVMNADGSGRARLTNSLENFQPDWSPDGSQIAFTSGRDGNAEIYVMNADGSAQTNLTNDPGPDGEPAWSPDGQQIAFVRDGIEDIFLMNPDGTGQHDLTQTPTRSETHPSWQPRTTTITVRNLVRPSSTSLRVDLSVDGAVILAGAGDGASGTTIVEPGTHQLEVAASTGSSLAAYVTSISCATNGGPDVAARLGDPADLDLAALDTVVCTVTSTRGQPTPTGSNVVVSPADATTGTSPVTITFGDVLGEGVTTVVSSPSGPAPPAGFALDGVYYSLETTASFPGLATVCIPYTGSAPTLVHWVGGDATGEQSYVVGNQVCIDVSSFSPFALVRPVGGGDTEAPRIECGAADGNWHAGNVSIECTAEDAGSGLRDAADAAFSLSTAVAAGSEDGNASTGSHEVCDNAGHCATAGPIGGNQIDRRPPRLALPAAKTVDATGPAGATVSFTATASDGADPHPGVSCAPASGARFPIGTSTVRCTATDHAGNSDQGSFTVTVRGAKEQLDRLLQAVIAASKLPPAVKTQLLAQLRATVGQFEPGKPAQRKAACTTLTAFTIALRLLSGHGIPAAQATQWIADADRIRAVIGCGP